MTHTVHNLQQGTPEWHTFRSQHYGASEAAAMLGLSANVTRTELLKVKSTGIAKEFSDFVQDRVLDRGHEVEALARPIIEAIIGEELYPATCGKGSLSASCDGLTIDDKKAFEHKQWNESLAAAVRAKQLPDSHMPQCQQIMMVTGAEMVIFVVSDGTKENMEYMEVYPDQEWQDRIAAGWAQFEADLVEFVPVVEAIKPTGRAPESLPALLIEITGAVKASNLTEFKGFALAVFDGINKDLQTDEDFANAEQTVKWCGEVEDRLAAAKQHALSQTSTIDALFRTIDEISSEARRVRLDLDKLVKARKESIKGEIVAEGVAKMKSYMDELIAILGKPYMPSIPVDFGGVIKGKRSVSSIRDAVDTELARAKIAATDISNRIQFNLNYWRKHAKDHAFLFSDTSAIVLKQPDDLQILVKSRIADHQAAEAAKEEATRARIRAEEQAKAQKEADDRAAEAAKKAEDERFELWQKEALALAECTPVAIKEVAKEVIDAPIIAAGSRVVVPMTKPAPSAAPTLRLGVINERLAPIVLTSDGLASLGFPFVAMDKAAKLYNESDFGLICAALVNRINQAQAQRAA